MQNDDSPNESIFAFDNHGRLQSMRFPKYCIGPRSDAVKGGAILQLVICKTSENSWQVTKEGRLMLQGSMLALDYFGNSEGEKPRLRKLAKRRIKQRWHLQSIK